MAASTLGAKDSSRLPAAYLPFREVLIVDPAVEDADILLAGLQRPLDIVRLAYGSDPIAQIADALAGRWGVPALHVLCHGGPGSLQLAGCRVDAAMLDRRAADLSAIRRALAEDGSVVLWACNAAAGTAGRRLLTTLHGHLERAVAGSTTRLGGGSEWTADASIPADRPARPPFAAAALAAYPSMLDTITGSDAADVITGTAGDDVIVVYGGDDVVTALQGNDLLSGGDGNDTLLGAGDGISSDGGNDTLFGGSGDDYLSTAWGDDLLYGGDGNDLIRTKLGTNVLYGGAGNDTLSGGLGNDTLSGGDGDDAFYGGRGHNLIYGGAGNDLFVPDTVGTDTYYGGAGDDTISVGYQTELIHGGDGNDLIQVISNPAGSRTIFTDAGNDTISGRLSWLSGSTISDFQVGDTLVIQQVNLSNLNGTAATSTITSNGSTITLTGLNSDSGVFSATYANGETTIKLVVPVDHFTLTTGVDAPTFTSGADTITADTANVLNAGDSLDGSGGSDVLTVSASQTVTLAATTLVNVETVNITGGTQNIATNDATVASGQTLTVNASTSTADVTWNGSAETDGRFAITGGSGNDHLTGGAGADTIYGGAGDDRIVGGAGADTLVGGAGNDTFSDSATNFNGDVISDFAVGDKLVVSDAVGMSALDGQAATSDINLDNTHHLTLSGITAASGTFKVVFDNGTATLTLVAPASSGGSGSGDGGPLVVNNNTGTGTGSGTGGVTTTTTTISNSGAEPGTAAIVENTSNNGNLVKATVPTSVSISSEGPSSAQSGTDAVNTLVNAIDARQSTGNTALIGDAKTFLNTLSTTSTLDVRTIVPSFTGGVSTDDPIVITGTSGGSQSEAFVIDMRGLSGHPLQLNNIEFASIIGNATVSGGAGNNYAVGDDSAQFISLGEGDDTLYGGAGNDTIGSGNGVDHLFGNEGSDTVFGGTDGDMVYGNQDSDVVYGNQGVDTLYGGQATDTLYGGQDNDFVYGNLGDDVAYGNLGDDTLYGGQGNDTLYGGDGDDVLVGGAGSTGDDLLVGGAGNDTLSGNLGNDTLSGGAGNDLLAGGSGDDTLSGGDGNDILSGGAGNDLIATGSGQDTVVVVDGSGIDTVSDFDGASGDRIQIASNINGTGIDTFAELQAAASDNSDGNVQIDLGSGNTLVLTGVKAADLQSGWFVFT